MKIRALLLLFPLLGCAPDTALPDPGEFVLHRLNRAEYNNTVRDLFLTDLRPADDFPADDFGFGYDNIAATLSLSPLHLELYERAADRVIDDALHGGVTYPLELAAEAEDTTATVATAGSDFGAGFWNLSAEGTLTATLEVPVAGTWFAGARAFGHSAGGELARLQLAVDGAVLGSWDVTDVAGDAQLYGAELELSEGAHTVAVAFTNDFESAATGADRNLLVDRLVLRGPVGVASPPDVKRDRLIPCDPAALGRRTCAAHAIRTVTERAWRRPIAESELLALLGIYDLVIVEDDFDLAVATAVKAAMLSPWFVFRVELDDNANDPTPHPLSPHELAARLSYFIWSSTPDDALLDAAASGALETDEQIAQQVARMLGDARAEALVDNFAGQWLFIRAVDDAAPDGATWPDFDDPLRAAMKEEMTLFFTTFLDEDRSMLELLTARETFLNERLAAHYGLTGFTFPADGSFTRVAFDGERRIGILTQGAMLTATSYPLRTSPTRRGKWMLEQLLCQGPPPPPPGVEGLAEDSTTQDPATVRERLEQHAADPTCASCHVRMDAMGFALEHFDAVGVWRDSDQGQPIDAAAQIDGEPFDGAVALGAWIASQRSVPRCMAQQLYTYALGRGPQTTDWPVINAINGRFEEGGYRLSELVEAIALSTSFRSRRGGQELPTEPPPEVPPEDATPAPEQPTRDGWEADR